MITASRILGDEVGSTAPLFLAFLAIHVLAGLTAVATGAIAALTRKGSPRHVRAGRWYYRAITVLFATATVLAAMRWRQDYRLFIIGAVAFTAATIGYQHQRRRRPGDTGHIAGMGAAYVAMLTAFYVDNGPHLPLWDHLPPLAFLLLPSAIGAPIIAHAVIRARQRRPGASGAADPGQAGSGPGCADWPDPSALEQQPRTSMPPDLSVGGQGFSLPHSQSRTKPINMHLSRHIGALGFR
ncbi:MAG TPA: hypothetical protein VGI74_09750 [Streptosporangiaceae bacterium]